MSMIDEGREEEIGGLMFVALMFLGGGVGLIFGKPEVGGAIGMGLGFLAMAFLKGKKVERVELSIPRTLSSLLLVAIGLLAIAAGVCILVAPGLLYPCLAGVAAIAIGLLLALSGMVSFRKS